MSRSDLERELYVKRCKLVLATRCLREVHADNQALRSVVAKVLLQRRYGTLSTSMHAAPTQLSLIQVTTLYTVVACMSVCVCCRHDDKKNGLACHKVIMSVRVEGYVNTKLFLTHNLPLLCATVAVDTTLT